MTTDAERIVGLYRRHANVWSRKRRECAAAPLMEAEWLNRFRQLLPDRPSVLDVGCGSGEPIGRHLIETGCDVTGVDSAPEMIAMCQSAMPRHCWRVADMRSLALRRRFDGVLAWDSFFHLTPEDQRAMFDVFREHAAPNGVLMFTSGPAYGVAMGTFEGEPLYHASLDSAEYRALLEENGFRVIAHAVEDPKCGRHTIWLSQLG
jgi:SAM-dependent methyltransferase